jgi:hypothetical protein
VSPQFSNRMIEATRSVLNRYIPDIYLYSDVYKGEDSGKYVQIVPSQAGLSSRFVLLDLQDMGSLSLRKLRHLPFTVLRQCHSQELHRRTSLFGLRDRYSPK